jgi:predicted MFS family arabinose efflux permease
MSLGNMGMLLSASPLAWVVEAFGWRAGFWVAVMLGFIIAGASLLYVPNDKPKHARARVLRREMIEVARLAISPALRGLIILALASLAVVLVFRGLWGGPWLMEVKGLPRLNAGNILFIFTLALIAGPFLMGLADRKLGHRRAVVAVAHLVAAAVLFLMAGGAPGYIVSTLFGVPYMPASYDLVLLIGLGFSMSAQPLIFAMTRQAVAVENTGKALSAVNLAFFLGTAMMQSATDPIAALWGLPVVLLFMGGSLVVGTLAFLSFTRAKTA